MILESSWEVIIRKGVINMRDSKKTQVLFDKAVNEIDQVLSDGRVTDKALMDIVLKAFLGPIKVRNLEVREDALKFVVSRNLSVNIKQLKKVLPKVLPEYCK